MSFLNRLKQQIQIKEETEKPKGGWIEKEGQLMIDMYQTPEEIIIEAPIAGADPEKFEITLEGDTIIIEGERQLPDEKREYLIRECFWGRFSRRIVVASEVNFERAEAQFRDGILTIRIPRLKKEIKRKIPVR